MPNHPLLVLPQPEIAERGKLFGGGGTIRVPSSQKQAERLQARFEMIRQSFRDTATRIDGLEPEHVVVLVAAGRITDLARAAQQVPGLEWLAEWDLDDAAPDEDFAIDNDPTEAVPQRLFALMSNQAAIDSLISLWNEWTADPKRRARTNFGPFKLLFQHLRDVRRWSAEDRIIDTGIREYWTQELQLRTGLIRFEAELWYRGDAAKRMESVRDIEALVTAAGGRRLAGASIDSIHYHGVLLECPATSIQSTLDNLAQAQYADILRCESVMFFRPVPQSALPPRGDDPLDVGAARRTTLPTGAPIAALFDGLPLEQHADVAGRLIVDDPDDFARLYRPGEQRHGTSMASLIIHGDLSHNEDPLPHPLYARPLLRPEGDGPQERYETFPSDHLFVDLFHRAVLRLVAGDGQSPPVGPTVRVINVSLGNPWQPFVRELSPLARLVDWLAWKYNLLFIISAGNCLDDILLGVTRGEYAALDPVTRSRVCIKSLFELRHHRRLLSPAESINALTIGALHSDSSDQAPLGYRVDLFDGKPTISPLTRFGLGLNRAVKPEVLLPGGRQLYDERITGPNEPAQFSLNSTSRSPGLLAASPGRTPGELSKRAYVRGTSNAAALATRLAVRIIDALTTVLHSSGPHAPDDSLITVLTKALLVHGASWEDPDNLVASLTENVTFWQEERRIYATLLGFGQAAAHRSLTATNQRVLLIGAGRLAEGRAHRFDIPVPEVLSGEPWHRRLVSTIAWMSPLNPRHRGYRRARLYLSGAEAAGFFGSTTGPDDKLAGRGTVQHLVRETNVRHVLESPTVALQVNCKADAGTLDVDVPYGLAVTIELAEPLEVDLYQPVRDYIRERVKIQM